MSAQGLPQVGRRQQDSVSEPADAKKCDECDKKQAQIDRLKVELDEWQQRCRLAEEQSRRTRDELQSLEGEMEELHDNFKEEENEQFEQVKQELDACLKNCKILQIRLNKSERQYNQLEQVKEMLERQLQERLTSATTSASPSISMRANCETDCDNKPTRQQDKPPFELEISPGGSQGNEMEFVKLTASEYDQMLRDLNDTSERERDLQEQIKYSQEEAQMKGERLQAIEVENEILMGRVNKLTLTNSSLRSSSMLSSSQQVDQAPNQDHTNEVDRVQKFRELCEQNEHMKLALELAQSEAERLRARLQEGHKLLEEAKEKVIQAKRQAEQEAAGQNQRQPASRASSRLELECRQLRARLVHSERECRQLRSQLECLGQSGTPAGGRRLAAGAGFRSYSLESPSTTSGLYSAESGQNSATCGSSRCQEFVRQLERQCKSLLDRNNQLELKLKKLVEMSSENLEQRSSSLESELIQKLKLQLDTSESELAKAKSRLVELDIECGRAQRQYKRLMSSLESCGSKGGELQLLRRNKLPSESLRDSLSRQELRQALRDLELDIEDLMTLVRAKECLIREQSSGSIRQTSSELMELGDPQPDRGQQQQQQASSLEQQVKGLRRQLEQERLLSNNLKLDVANLEQESQELKSYRLVMERERLAMEEEVDKLRQRLGEQCAELEDGLAERQRLQSRCRELNETVERLKVELAEASRRQTSSRPSSADSDTDSMQATSAKRDLLLMARDLSELKVKNGFLMRQLEMAREDAARQLDEWKVASEAQQRRAVELAQIELKERHLQEGQILRDELSELKQKLAQANRQSSRLEEEMKQERERARAMERDWRRDKQQWQQAREQLDGQLAIERRSSELKLKEVDSVVRDKERSLISVQDRCVQLERDLKRVQNKYHLLEEDNESKIKQLSRDLEARTRDLNEALRQKRAQEEQQYDSWRRLNEEKSTLKETLETIKRSYDEKLVEARQLRELLRSRQEQAYKERAQLLERIEALTRRQTELIEHETQSKLIKQRLEIQERQLEVARRELISLKEERAKLRDRCDELEKRELISKTSSISGSTSFMRPFGSKTQLVGKPVAQLPAQSSPSRSTSVTPSSNDTQQQQQQQQQQLQAQSLIEKLSGKINDQRNLINILRQQCNDSQVELKQMRLLQMSERSKWQTTVAQLTGRLNECEEKLAYETLVLQANPMAIDQLARPKLETNWHSERAAQLELIKQQQSQMELLTRDHKKLSQAHDLLRLHSKQLEGHNNKLSRKLIELQQASLVQPDRRLESIHEQLLNQHRNLSHELRPVLEIVSKMVSSLDAPEQQQQVQPLRQATLSTSRPVCSGTHSPSSDSTERPLRAGSTPIVAASRLSSDQESDLEATSNVITSSSRPTNKSSTTRLTQLLAGGKLSNQTNSSNLAGVEKSTTSAATTTTTSSKSTRRVRVKCSTLGITTAEKRQLKQQLKKLTESLEADSRSEHRFESATGNLTPDSRAHSSSTNEQAPLTDQPPRQTQMPRIRWQLDSDLESERSWSLEPVSNEQLRSDVYRRFPQASPGGRLQRHQSGATSLTEYESESSLAGSDFSLAGGYLAATAGAPRASGAESDSGIASKLTNGRKKSSGLKGRLTSTLRNISRSITGLGTSDTENSGEILNPKRRVRVGENKSGRETRV